MNKTVNINLAGIFFHIDEDAYNKLQHYLDAIKRSFTSTQGAEEIIADIEARIAELFGEKLKTDRQVISMKEVEEVISIMGQPEDYMVDEEIFEDEPVYTNTGKKHKKQLFRDTEHSYIGGVSSGLAHYVGTDPVWIRIAWVLLTIFSTGAFILVYIALWIFIPEAKTTADKLAMRGEEVTISNIERKIREGFDGVADKMKGVDYNKYGNKAKSGASSAATAISDLIMFVMKLFVKIIGVILLLMAGSTLIGLFIGLFTVGTFGIIDAPWNDYIAMAVTGAPLWLISLLTFFLVGIPFFFLFILGLKILSNNVKSIGTTAKLVLLGLWFISLIGLGIISIQQATARAFEGEVVNTETLPITANDTIFLRMQNNSHLSSRYYRDSGFDIKQDENDQKVLIGTDIRLIVKSTKDSLAKIEVLKMADGKDSKEARDRAANIRYNTSFINNELLLDAYFTADMEYKYVDQEVQVTLYLPEGTILYADENTYSFHRNSDHYRDILNNGDEEKFLTIMQDEAVCDDCPVRQYSDEDEWDSDYEMENHHNENGKEIRIQINDSVFEMRKDNVKMIKIDKNSVEINKD